MIKKIQALYYRFFKGGVAYARYLGVKVGENCLIATRNWSSEPYLIEIGNNVQITSNVSIHTHGGAHVARTQFPNFDIFGKVIIKDGAYIGAFSQIMPGVTIGEGALVAAGSVVTKSIPARVVVAGNPARYVCSVEEYIARNLPYNAETKDLSYDEKKKVLLAMDESKYMRKPELLIRK